MKQKLRKKNNDNNKIQMNFDNQNNQMNFNQQININQINNNNYQNQNLNIINPFDDSPFQLKNIDINVGIKEDTEEDEKEDDEKINVDYKKNSMKN